MDQLVQTKLPPEKLENMEENIYVLSLLKSMRRFKRQQGPKRLQCERKANTRNVSPTSDVYILLDKSTKSANGGGELGKLSCTKLEGQKLKFRGYKKGRA